MNRLLIILLVLVAIATIITGIFYGWQIVFLVVATFAAFALAAVLVHRAQVNAQAARAAHAVAHPGGEAHAGNGSILTSGLCFFLTPVLIVALSFLGMLFFIGFIPQLPGQIIFAAPFIGVAITIILWATEVGWFRLNPNQAVVMNTIFLTRAVYTGFPRICFYIPGAMWRQPVGH